MIGTRYTYKDFTFQGSTAYNNRIVLTDVKRSVPLRTSIFTKESYHGSNTSLTLAGGRLFTFSGTIFGATRAERATGQAILSERIKPEGIFGENKGFYELSWYEDDGTRVKCDAKVYGMPDFSASDSVINFSFDLYVNDPTFVSYSEQQSVNTINTILGGTTLGTTLGVAMNDYSIQGTQEVPLLDVNGIEISDVDGNPIYVLQGIESGGLPNATNNGNFEARCYIRLEGELDNPKITNVTNGRYYKLDGVTTTDLVLDNTGTTFIVEDDGVNVKQYRDAGSRQIFLSPGRNDFLISADNLTVDTFFTLTINWNDTYINS